MGFDAAPPTLGGSGGQLPGDLAVARPRLGRAQRVEEVEIEATERLAIVKPGRIEIVGVEAREPAPVDGLGQRRQHQVLIEGDALDRLAACGHHPLTDVAEFPGGPPVWLAAALARLPRPAHQRTPVRGRLRHSWQWP